MGTVFSCQRIQLIGVQLFFLIRMIIVQTIEHGQLMSIFTDQPIIHIHIISSGKLGKDVMLVSFVQYGAI